MAKLNKMYYYTSKKEKKLNCYYVILKKEMIEKAGLGEEVDIKVENGKIIIKDLTKNNILYYNI
jgi:hypothetical protein